MTDYYIKGSTGIIRAPSGGGGGSGGSVRVGIAASTLIGFGDQAITPGSGYVGIFHDAINFGFGPCAFDGYNITLLDAAAQGIWKYEANGKIVGSPATGSLRVVIAGLVYAGAYAGELARQVFTAADFAAQGFVGYGVWAQAFLGLGDNMGIYLINDTDASLTIEQGDPNDGTGPPACQVLTQLLSFQDAPTGGGGS